MKKLQEAIQNINEKTVTNYLRFNINVNSASMNIKPADLAQIKKIVNNAVKDIDAIEEIQVNVETVTNSVERPKIRILL